MAPSPRPADGGGRAAHLHLLPPGSPRWDEQIAFRDALRADRDLADEYAQLKTDLAAAYADREAYTDGKADFVRRVLADARPARYLSSGDGSVRSGRQRCRVGPSRAVLRHPRSALVGTRLSWARTPERASLTKSVSVW